MFSITTHGRLESPQPVWSVTTNELRPARAEHTVVLSARQVPPPELAELRAVLPADYQWRRSEGID